MHANDWDPMDPIRWIVGTNRVVDRLGEESVPLVEIVAKLG
jgi:hypothetical protein